MEDKAIVQLYWDREEQAISATAQKYGNYCKKVAMNILQDDQDAMECVNDTYLKAWNSMPPHRPGRLSTFLGKITRNLAFDVYKHEHTEKRGKGQMDLVLDELTELIPGGLQPQQELDRKELIREINAFLGSLPAEKRQIFVCRYWYADSVTDIAKQFHMSVNTVSVQLRRVRNRLRKYLEGKGYEQ